MCKNINDVVWVARFHAMEPTYIECPDCGGTGRIRVIMHDDSEHSIECGNCQSGYNAPTGLIQIYQHSIDIRQETIVGISITNDAPAEYRTYYGGVTYITPENEIFDDKESAQQYGQQKYTEFLKEQEDQIYKKEKDTRTWAWNVSYHRRNIKEAQRQLEYHTKKLNVASLKAKEDKTGKVTDETVLLKG